jgi:hypothetical protein
VVLAITLAGLAVLGAVVVLSMGRGGELAEAHPDHPPLALQGNHGITGTDAALLRLPTGVWGYHAGITDEALDRLAYALTERDTRIAVLEQQLEQLRIRQGVDDVEEPIRWNVEREPQSSWNPPGVLPSWSAGELLSAQEQHEPYDPYAAYDRDPGPGVTSEDGAEVDDQGRDR